MRLFSLVSRPSIAVQNILERLGDAAPFSANNSVRRQKHLDAALRSDDILEIASCVGRLSRLCAGGVALPPEETHLLMTARERVISTLAGATNKSRDRVIRMVQARLNGQSAP